MNPQPEAFLCLVNRSLKHTGGLSETKIPDGEPFQLTVTPEDKILFWFKHDQTGDIKKWGLGMAPSRRLVYGFDWRVLLTARSPLSWNPGITEER